MKRFYAMRASLTGLIYRRLRLGGDEDFGGTSIQFGIPLSIHRIH